MKESKRNGAIVEVLLLVFGLFTACFQNERFVFFFKKEVAIQRTPIRLQSVTQAHIAENNIQKFVKVNLKLFQYWRSKTNVSVYAVCLIDVGDDKSEEK